MQCAIQQATGGQKTTFSDRGEATEGAQADGVRTGGREQSGGFRPDGSEWEGQEMSGTHGMQAFGAGAGSKLRSVRGGKKAPATDAGGRHGPKENTGGNSGL